MFDSGVGEGVGGRGQSEILFTEWFVLGCRAEGRVLVFEYQKGTFSIEDEKKLNEGVVQIAEDNSVSWSQIIILCSWRSSSWYRFFNHFSERVKHDGVKWYTHEYCIYSTKRHPRIIKCRTYRHDGAYSNKLTYLTKKASSVVL